LNKTFSPPINTLKLTEEADEVTASKNGQFGSASFYTRVRWVIVLNSAFLKAQTIQW
jgi:hypothetical protein